LLIGEFNQVFCVHRDALRSESIHAGSNVSVITCYTHFNEFYTRLPVFDQIANTFRTLNQ